MIVPVILSGGAGTRLWPASRQNFPKPFMDLGGRNLAQMTLERANALATGPILTVTGSDHYPLTRRAYAAASVQADRLHYLLEPVGRNTAPAVAMAAHLVSERFGPDAIMLVMPADHVIADIDAFKQAVDRAKTAAVAGYLVTFGIEPDRPETGYGYIRQGEPMDIDGAFHIASFTEKPDLETARTWLAAGGYQWNAGIFCFTAARLLQALQSHSPDVAACALDCWNQTPQADTAMVELPLDDFARCPSISIDYALMEPADRKAVVPCSIGWNDLGSWDSLATTLDSDQDNNATHGDATLIDSNDCIVYAQSRLVTVAGVSHLAVIETPDAVMVCDAHQSQGVKDLVDELKRLGRPEASSNGASAGNGWQLNPVVAGHLMARELVIDSQAVFTVSADIRSITVATGQVQIGDVILKPWESAPVSAGNEISALNRSVCLLLVDSESSP